MVSGGNDALASFHGAGLVEPGDAVDAGGTAGGLGVYWDQEVAVPGTYRAPAALPGLWLYGGAMNAVGKSVDWVLGMLAPGDRGGGGHAHRRRLRDRGGCRGPGVPALPRRRARADR